MSLPSPAELTALAQAGGWLFAALVLAVVLVALSRGDLAPGWIYKREIERADKATDMLSQITGAVDRQTTVISSLAGQIETLVRLEARQ